MFHPVLAITIDDNLLGVLVAAVVAIGGLIGWVIKAATDGVVQDVSKIEVKLEAIDKSVNAGVTRTEIDQRVQRMESVNEKRFDTINNQVTDIRSILMRLADKVKF